MECGELIYAYILTELFKNSCRKGRALVERHARPSDLFRRSRKELLEMGLLEQQVDEMFDPRNKDKAKRETDWLLEHRVQPLFLKDSNYPYRLRECPDAPVLLFYLGNADLNAERTVSIVGTRKMTGYGASCCRQIVKELARLQPAPLIISGLAYGVDICAHKTALECGMQTVGVMATGIDSIYPSHHRSVAGKMTGQGGLVTDFPRKTPPLRSNFIRRNRIIAGMSDAVVLIESAARGGGLITARLAASYSREVFALPGRIDDPYSQGCNRLLHEHIAAPLISPGTIAGSMQWDQGEDLFSSVRTDIVTESDCEEKRQILNALLTARQLSTDELFQLTGIELGELAFHLTELEMAGRIVSDLNNKYTLY